MDPQPGMDIITPFPTIYPPTDDYSDLKVSPDKKKCNQYVLQNKTHFIYGGYEGIPENLLINFLGWIVSIDLFGVVLVHVCGYLCMGEFFFECVCVGGVVSVGR